MFRLPKIAAIEMASGTPCPRASLTEIAASRRAKHFSVSSQTLRTLEDANVRPPLLLNYTKSPVAIVFVFVALVHLNTECI